MPFELAQLTGGWPLAFPLLAAASARSLAAGRRRTALNEALHELRRPLQALTLAAPTGAARAADVESALRMAGAAIERLEQEINGEAAAAVRAPLAVRPLLEAAVARWQRRALHRGASLRLRWAADEAMVSGNRAEIAQALDNLIVNALEHGGPDVVVAAASAPGAVRISVSDRGRRRPRGEGPAGLLARLSGRSRHCHGLRVVRPDEEHEVLGPSEAMRKGMGGVAIEAGTRAILEKLARTEPTTLALMHGSSFQGDGAAHLLGLAKALGV